MRQLFRSLAIVGALLLCAAAGARAQGIPNPPPGGAACRLPPAPLANYSFVWGDDFCGYGLNRTLWSERDVGSVAGTSKIPGYVRAQNGMLTVEAKPAHFTGGSGNSWINGSIQSQWGIKEGMYLQVLASADYSSCCNSAIWLQNAREGDQNCSPAFTPFGQGNIYPGERQEFNILASFAQTFLSTLGTPGSAHSGGIAAVCEHQQNIINHLGYPATYSSIQGWHLYGVQFLENGQNYYIDNVLWFTRSEPLGFWPTDLVNLYLDNRANFNSNVGEQMSLTHMRVKYVEVFERDLYIQASAPASFEGNTSGLGGEEPRNPEGHYREISGTWAETAPICVNAANYCPGDADATKWDQQGYSKVHTSFFILKQPTAGDTLTINGNTITFVSSGAATCLSGGQANIAGSLSATASNLATQMACAGSPWNAVNYNFDSASGDNYFWMTPVTATAEILSSTSDTAAFLVYNQLGRVHATRECATGCVAAYEPDPPAPGTYTAEMWVDIDASLDNDITAVTTDGNGTTHTVTVNEASGSPGFVTLCNACSFNTQVYKGPSGALGAQNVTLTGSGAGKVETGLIKFVHS